MVFKGEKWVLMGMVLSLMLSLGKFCWGFEFVFVFSYFFISMFGYFLWCCKLVGMVIFVMFVSFLSVKFVIVW